MNLYFIIAIAAGIAGILGTTYYKGQQACASAYEVRILKAKIKNQEIALGYYKSAKANADKLSKDAANQEMNNLKELPNVDKAISKPECADCCIDDGFMRSLERIR